MGEQTTQPLDLDALEGHLDLLLASYHDAVRYVEHLPFFGRVDIEIGAKPSRTARSRRGIGIGRALNALLIPRHAWAARSLVRLFVDSHIEAKLRPLLRALLIELTACIKYPQTKDRAERLESYVQRLDQLKKALYPWNRLGAVVTKAPWLPVVVAFATPVLVMFTGIDLSSANAAVESLRRVLQSPDPLRPLFLLGVLLVYVYMLLAPLLVRLGFRVKRALFSGGGTVWRLFDAPEDMRWVGFPGINIYRLENALFEFLEVRKPREFPLDFVLSFLPYYVLVVAVALSVGAVDQLMAGGDLGTRDTVGLASFWLLAGAFGVYGWFNLRDRIGKKNL